MRIAFATWSRRRAGGVETYVEQVLAAFALAGHDVALWSEVDEPGAAEPIALPSGTPSALLAAGAEVVLGWKPDALIVNGLQDPALEARLLAAAPSLFVAHNFYGTCISGKKSWSAPVERPCARRFGAACLLHYFPHRCGGLNPATMVSLYTRERRRLSGLAQARRIVTLSEFMRAEYVRQGFSADRVVCVPYGPGGAAAVPSTADRVGRPPSIAFLGRLERLKGTHLLLEAAASVARDLGSLSVTILGDGPERSRLEQQAQALSATTPEVHVTFTGRVSPDDRDALLRTIDLLVVPSLWPEPLGLVGFEAGRLGVPAVAFDVGGIRQWLTDGRNGLLVPGDPPTAAALASVLSRALRDAPLLARLRDGAIAEASTAPTPRDHAEALLRVLGDDRRATH